MAARPLPPPFERPGVLPVNRSIVPLGVAMAIVIGQASATIGQSFQLLDGDRVVLIGGTMIERDQSTGYLEARLTLRHPDRSITFRNLGWSGDTVEGISRAGFGPPADGYKHLVDHVLALKPTVILLGYGANEAFEGAAGLPRFLQDLDKLLKAIEPTRARLVFLSPTRQEDLGPPLPDPTRHNAELVLYGAALKAEAEKRGTMFVDLFGLLPDGSRATPRRPLTNNGLHFTPYGYWRAAEAVEKALVPPGRISEVGGSPGGLEPVSVSIGDFMTEFSGLEEIPAGVRFRLLDEMLPTPPPPADDHNGSRQSRVFAFSGLKPGRHALKVDGKPVVSVDAEAWKKGVAITRGPEFDQSEALRSAIVAKNELYFHRWRPQNETYLFGFRKHEQGQNAREIPQFDPLVAAKEAEIARLRAPVPHVYELIREGEVGR